MRRPQLAPHRLVAQGRRQGGVRVEGRCDHLGGAPRLRSLDEGQFARLGVDEPAIGHHDRRALAPRHRRCASPRGGDGRVADRPMFFRQTCRRCSTSRCAVDGNHVLSLETLYTPYSLRGGWETSHEPERWLQRLATLVEGDFESTILRWRAMTPLSYEREFNLPNATDRLRGLAAVGDARAGSRAHALRDPGQRALPHRSGDLSRRRCVGCKRAQHRDRYPCGADPP
jgi:hypothetical protein